jgi:hypothetical protein
LLPAPMRLLPAVALLLWAFPAFGQHCITDEHAEGVIHGTVFTRNGNPASGVNVELNPLGVILDYVLPETMTDQRGEYRFEHVCRGRFSVVVRDEKAGYPIADVYINRILYGGPIPEVKITKSKFDAHLLITLPPKAAQLQIRLFNSQTKAKIERVEAELIVDRKRSMKTYCDGIQLMKCDDAPFFLVPPDQDVFLHVTSNGFQEWKESAGRGKLIHVASGELLILDVELDPLQP